MNTLFNPATTAEILQRIDGLNPDTKPLWGKMTANQMVCHTTDPFRDLLKIRITKPVMPAFLRPMMKRFLINEKPFSKNAPTVKPYLQSPKGNGTKPTDFQTDKSELKRLIARFSQIEEGFSLGDHGALGQLTKEQAGQFMWKHLDHHLRQFGL